MKGSNFYLWSMDPYGGVVANFSTGTALEEFILGCW